MKALVEAALVGLGRAGTPPADPEEPGERLLARTNDLAPERAFLLRLGVHAVRARAGLAPALGAERPEAAPPEPRAPCSPALAAIVADLCANRNKAILAEALARIDARGLRLPPQVIPALAELREVSSPAGGNERGGRARALAGATQPGVAVVGRRRGAGVARGAPPRMGRGDAGGAHVGASRDACRPTPLKHGPGSKRAWKAERRRYARSWSRRWSPTSPQTTSRF